MIHLFESVINLLSYASLQNEMEIEVERADENKRDKRMVKRYQQKEKQKGKRGRQYENR